MSRWPRYYAMEPLDIEQRYSNEKSYGNLDLPPFELSEYDQKRKQRVYEMLRELPEREADFMELYYFKKINQMRISKIFGVSQPTVCYRLRRAIKRVQFMLETPALEVDYLRGVLEEVLDEEVDRKIMVLMWETTCQSEVARQLGVTQGLVRHRFMRGIKKLSAHKVDPDVIKAFDMVSNNLNILREVKRDRDYNQWTHVIA